jgi:hypothetical protein
VTSARCRSTRDMKWHAATRGDTLRYAFPHTRAPAGTPHMKRLD